MNDFMRLLLFLAIEQYTVRVTCLVNFLHGFDRLFLRVALKISYVRSEIDRRRKRESKQKKKKISPLVIIVIDSRKTQKW